MTEEEVALAKHPKFEIFVDKSGNHRFRLTAKNGQAVLASQGYASRDTCKKGVASVRANAPDDARYERTTASNGQFRFNLKAANRKTIGTSELYKTATARDKGIESVKKNGPVAEVEDV
jgi:uncharacterized protein